MDNVYKNIEEYKPNKKQKVLIVFDDMIADMLTKKKLNPMVTRLFTRAKLSISLVFITQSDFPVPRNIRLNSTQNFFFENSKQKRTSKNAFNHSSNIDFHGYMNPYKKCTLT